MKLRHLKFIRVIISLIFFLFLAFLFIDFRNLLPLWLTKSLLYFQFIPSLFKFVEYLSITVIGFILVLLFTALFGRVYCSTICPLGTLQDMFSFLSKKTKKKKKRFSFTKPHTILRYSILVLTIVIFIFGSIVLINLLDPYSNFGRIFTNLFRPVYILLNNGLARILAYLGSYAIFPVAYKKVNLVSILFPLGFLILLFWLAFSKGRLYCNTICPVGTLLGFISKKAVFKIRINESACNSCSLCGDVCKSSCIDSNAHTVDMSRCVGCFNCLTVCRRNAMKYQPLKPNTTKPVQHSPERRKIFLTAMGLIGAKLLLAQENLTKFKTGLNFTKSKLPVTPAGSKGIRHFTNSCTACHLCVSACPTQVLQPSLMEYGLVGMLQPRLDFNSYYCTYECTVCSHICPSGAILPLTIEEKKNVQTGEVKFIKKNCVVYVNNTDCGACAEHCPTKAVHMIPFKDKLVIPEVTGELCVGCGACEHACPTFPYKAIYVESNAVHKKAKQPKNTKLQEKIDYKADFPF